MITSEVFYRAECDHEGCDAMLPNGDDEAGSHWPRESVMQALGEERGEHDETWTVVGDKTYCPRHAPGNIECGVCDGCGYLRAENPEYVPGRNARWNYTDCPLCGDRGYIVAGEIDPAVNPITATPEEN